MADDESINGWGRAAEALGISDDVLRRNRKRFGDKTIVPWWADRAAVKAWYAALIAPPPAPEKPVTRRRDPDGPIDPRQVARELARGGDR